ncbi:hypothetical protein Q669_03245 [Labrenzia sp. C1B10]|nr:hypothetical protein Q669_03245 [Labrenzia sp. C1B10]ERS05286.1 hypothetical protein Q675_02680 [Labrenzia sp. C1B70]
MKEFLFPVFQSQRTDTSTAAKRKGGAMRPDNQVLCENVLRIATRVEG